MTSLTFPIETYYLAVLLYGITVPFSIMKKERLSVFLLKTAFAVNLVSEVSGRYLIWPFCNMFSEPFFLPLCLAGISLVLTVRKRQEALSLVPLIAALSLAAVLFSEGYYPPFTLMSKSIYAHLFHFFVFIAHGFLIAGAYFAICSVFLSKRDYISYHTIAWGFAFLCTAGLFGMIWSYVGRSDVISWNHYYFHSIAIWFYYAGFLHLHLTKYWNQKTRAWLLAGGFLLIFFFDYLPQIGGIHAPGVLNTKLYELY